MTAQQLRYALRYAQAFFAVYQEQFNDADFSTARKASAWLRSNRQVLVFFEALCAHKSECYAGLIDVLIVRLGLAAPFKQLLMVIVEHGRIMVLPEVLRIFGYLYQERNNVLLFTVASACQLSDGEQAIFEKFLQQITGNRILMEYVVRPQLIAGVRMSSDVLLWEQSIYKQLKTVSKSLVT